MIIRCERCSTLYELDESLLAPDGSDVQCARCQHVFLARPQRASGQTLQGMPPVEPAPPPAERAPSSGPRPASSQAAAAEPARSAPSSATHQPARYTPAVASALRPPTSQPSVSRPPVLRRDTVGTFESRLRWSHRWRWLAPTLFVVALGLGVVAFLLRDSLVDPRAREAHRSALGIAYRDDLASLDEARSLLEEAIRRAPRLHAAQADLALVELLMAGVLLEQPSDSGAAPRSARGEALAAEAGRALDELERGGLAPAEVTRARAVAAALGTDRALVKRLATAGRGRLADDPLLQTAEQSAEIRSGDRAARERAIGALTVLVSRRPEVLRARWVLARGQALSGRRAEALATLDGLLRANARHEGGRALRDTLARPPAAPTSPSPTAPVAAPPPPPAAPQAARAEKPPLLPRKPVPPAGEVPGASSGGPRANSAADSPPAGDPVRPGQEPASGTPAGVPPGADHPPGDAAAAPRLKPAAVPDPEPVHSGG